MTYISTRALAEETRESTKEAMEQVLAALEACQATLKANSLGGGFTDMAADSAITTMRLAIEEMEKQKHAERLSLKGWQYFECPACGSEGARAFPQPEQDTSRPIYIAEVTMPEPDEIGPWCDGESWCLNCHHEWVAVWPLGAESLECPACGSMDTDRNQAEPHERKTK